MDRVDKEKLYTEMGIIQDVKEGLSLLVDNSESVFLAVILVACFGVAYIRSPQYSRKVEEIRRLQETNSQLAKNAEATLLRVDRNSKDISAIISRMDRIEFHVKELGEGNDDILQEIRDLRDDLRMIQGQFNYRKHR